MSSIKQVTSIKSKLKKGEHVGLLGKYIMYFLESLGIIGSVESPAEIKYLWCGTQEQYDALTETRNDTLYFIEE